MRHPKTPTRPVIRGYIWNKQGMDVPGLSKSDLQSLTEYVEKNSELQLFADQLIANPEGVVPDEASDRELFSLLSDFYLTSDNNTLQLNII